MIGQHLLGANAEAELLQNGFALVPNAVEPGEAVAWRELYADDALFRSRVVMERHAFGKGEYKYFARPLPARIGALRDALYEQLVPVANEWMHRLGRLHRFPPTYEAFLHECLESEQTLPTALLLRYKRGDYNRLHQDLYGPVAFPLQATFYLSRPGEEFGGGEVVLAEQKPRAQTRVHVLTPGQGDLLILPTSAAPMTGAKGWYKAIFRHGVATVNWGERFTLGIVLHDAR
ncbi:MAG: 2OG-Fe(II) oxygenase [Candidatus Eremiobacteraeota bacterium]|nr:2OG-Fe(II) oxygenase [Candidatus Eremiobacteraeota bacterium]